MMPLDTGNFEFEKDESNSSAEQPRVYVCEKGNVRLETRRFRRTFAPEEFVKLLRLLLPRPKRAGVLPVIQKQAVSSFCQRLRAKNENGK